MMGMAGKRKVIKLLNRSGPSVNYYIVETIEMQLSTSMFDQEIVLPDGVDASSIFITDFS